MRNGRVLRAIAAGAIGTAMLAIGASTASASQTFGSDLSEPVDTGVGSAEGCLAVCTVLVAHMKTGNALPDAAPISGVIVSFSIKTGGAEDASFVVGNVDGSGNATISAIGPSVVQPSAGTYSVAAQTPVTAGEVIGLNYVGNRSTPATCTGGQAYVYSPALAPGDPPAAPSLGGPCERLINATVEPDADHDGYGDETQDLCPTDASTHGACPATTPTPTPGPKKKCKKRKHRSLSASAAKKRCKKHHK